MKIGSEEAVSLINQLFFDSIELDDDKRGKLKLLREGVVEERGEKEGAEVEHFELTNYWSELDLYRFLCARDWDVDAALKQLKSTLKWREENNVDGLEKEEDINEPIFQRICPHLHAGCAIDGRPLYWERTGQVDVTRLVKEIEESGKELEGRTGPEAISRRHVRFLEILAQRKLESSMERKRPVYQHIAIMDMKGLSMAIDRNALNIFKDTVDIDQTHYPETLGMIFFVNCPWFFKTVTALIFPFLDSKTREKFHVLGSDHSKLLEVIDKSQLPVEYGGESEEIVVPILEPKGVEGEKKKGWW